MITRQLLATSFETGYYSATIFSKIWGKFANKNAIKVDLFEDFNVKVHQILWKSAIFEITESGNISNIKILDNINQGNINGQLSW